MAASCNADNAGPTPTPAPSDDVVRFGYPSEPPTLDPLANGGASAATRDILRPVLPALFRLDERLRPEPELVAAWPTESEFGREPFSVSLRLRRASWSDGKPITSTDVRFSFERLSQGPTGYRYRRLRDVEATGARSFTLHFDRPVRRWWSLFSLDDMVLPAHAYSTSWAERPTVSGGPFAVAEWTQGLRIRLVRNDSYWGAKAVAARIDVLFVPDEETRFQLLDRRELDAFFSEGDINIGRRARARGYLRTDGPLDGAKTASGFWGPTWWELAVASDVGAGVAGALIEMVDPDLVAEILEDTGAPMDGIPAVFPVPSGAIRGTWEGRGDVEDAKSRVGAGGDRELEVGFSRDSAGGSIASFMHFRMREVGVRTELVALKTDAFERSLDDGSRSPVVIRLRRGADAPDAASYAASSGEPGSAAVDEQVTGAETTGPSGGVRPQVGLAPEAWAQAQEGLESASSAAPIARVRTWIVGRAGLAGPRPLGTSSGPLWNASTWRLL
ncbi:MAG: ABC transporter substrate-binding protein [Actinomycetota bacterium]